MKLEIEPLKTAAIEFESTLAAQKKSIAEPDFPWYPYGTLNNFVHLDRLLKGANRDLANMIDGRPVADVGAADGDAAFFLESLGVSVDIVDYGPTNFNTLRGARKLKEVRNSAVNIHEMDLDAYFEWPRKDYGLVFFMGILYHLKNPFYVLESLSRVTKYAVISTHIAQYSVDYKTRFAELPVAYLVHSSETNNDASNFWIFSEAGLKRILDRAGWDVVDFMTAGNTKKSDPASAVGDERAFALIKSRVT